MPTCVKCGINVFDFYEMTLKEIQVYLEMYKENAEEKNEALRIQIYSQAQLTSMFIGYVLNGKPIPTYDNLFKKEKTMNIDLIKERLKDFANNHNRKG